MTRLTDIVCETCGATVRPRKPADAAPRMFCSYVCAGLAHSKLMQARYAESWRARFEARVEKHPSSGCWIWGGSISKRGYGVVRRYGKEHPTHRIAYEEFVGAIPHGMYVCHNCDDRACVNPDHLFLGTHAENMADMKAKRRQASGEKNGGAKLTKEMVHEILASTLPGISLARKFGVANATISQIRLGKRWVGALQL